MAASRRAPIKPGTHDAWFANLAVVALVFVGHPQRAGRAVVAHVAIGCCLLTGAYLLASEKKADFRQSSLDAVYAGAAVALAAVVLVAYREPTRWRRAPRRRGHLHDRAATWRGWLNGVAFVTAAWLLVSCVLDTRGRRAPRYELASMTEGGCPPAPDAVPKPAASRRRARAARRRRRTPTTARGARRRAPDAAALVTDNTRGAPRRHHERRPAEARLARGV